MKRPKTRLQLMNEYINNTDIVWKDDLYAMGVAHINSCLIKYTKKHNVEFIKIDEKCWEIKR